MQRQLKQSRNLSEPEADQNNAQELVVVYRSIAELKSHPRNARTHSKRQIRQIARSIEAFGFTSPVLINKTDTIVAGHGRVAAAKVLAIETVPTIQLEGLTDDEIRAYLIADNRIGEKAGWDQDILAIEFQHLLEIENEIDISVTGFEVPEVDSIILPFAKSKSRPDPDDAFDAAATTPPVTQVGDLWQLGEHRLLCGSALEEESYLKLLGENRAAMVFVDPPYNVKIEGNVSGKGAVKHGDFAMAAGEMDESEFLNFLTTSLELLAKFSVSGSVHYIAMDWRHMDALLLAGQEAYSQLLNMCVWAKERGGQGSFYRSAHESLLRFPEWERAAEEQYPAREVWPQPDEPLEVSERGVVFEERRSRTPP